MIIMVLLNPGHSMILSFYDKRCMSIYYVTPTPTFLYLTPKYYIKIWTLCGNFNLPLRPQFIVLLKMLLLQHREGSAI